MTSDSQSASAQPSDSTASILLGAGLITLGFLANTLQSAFGKAAQQVIGAGQFIWLAMAIALGLLLPVLVWRRGRDLRTEVLPYYLLRAVFGLGGFYLFVSAAKLGSLVNANVLLNTTPIFIPLIAGFILGERISPGLWGAIAIGFIGLLLIVQPGGELLQEPANLLALGAGLSAAIEFLTVRWLNRSESPLSQVAYYLLIGSVLTMPLALAQWQPPDRRTWGLVAGTVVAFLAFQFLLVRAYRYAKPHQIGVFQYTSVIFSAAIGWVWFDEVPGWVAAIGMVLITVGGAISIYLERRPDSKSAEETPEKTVGETAETAPV